MLLTECLHLPKIHVETPSPMCWCLEVGPLGGHEGGALMNGISTLIKETPERPPHFYYRRTSCEGTDSDLGMRRQALIRRHICWCLHQHYFRTVNNTYLVYKLPNLLQRPQGTKTAKYQDVHYVLKILIKYFRLLLIPFTHLIIQHILRLSHSQ